MFQKRALYTQDNRIRIRIRINKLYEFLRVKTFKLTIKQHEDSNISKTTCRRLNQDVEAYESEKKELNLS